MVLPLHPNYSFTLSGWFGWIPHSLFCSGLVPTLLWKELALSPAWADASANTHASYLLREDLAP